MRIKIAFVLFAFLSILAYLTLDITIVYFIYNEKLYRLNIFKYLSLIGNYQGIFILYSILILVSIFYKKIRKAVLFASISLVLAEGVIVSLKDLIGQARPYMLVFKHIYGFYPLSDGKDYHSFPSGHTVLNFSSALSFFKENKEIGSILLLFGILVAISRILLLDHFLSDILGSISISLLIVFVSEKVLNNLEK